MAVISLLRRSVAAALIGLALATPISAQSAGGQKLIEKQAEELGTYDERTPEQQRQANVAGSAVGGVVVLAVLLAIGFFILIVSEDGYSPA
jgi:hypothetical protein